MHGDGGPCDNVSSLIVVVDSQKPMLGAASLDAIVLLGLVSHFFLLFLLRPSFGVPLFEC